MPRESSTHAFLLTDIEGSTQSWERYATPMHAALDAHDHIFASVIEQWRGELINHTGDGVLAAFDTPEAAVGAAVAAQRRLRDVAVDRSGALRVRMAVHQGVVVHSGGRRFGPTLNRCARIMAAAHGGQILASGTVAAMLAPDRSAGLALRDLGWHHLRDVPEPMRLYQVCAEGLEAEFPPLRQAGTVEIHHLPHTTSSFIGRVSALTTLQSRLDEHRVVTLLGPAGSGKSRLAAEVTQRRAHHHVDGAWFISLADAGEDTSVISALARALGIQEAPGRSQQDTVRERLRDARVLLILDNCEHLVAELAPLVDRLLLEAPDVRVLATSQRRLGVRGEAVFEVGPMSIGEAETLAVDQGDAVRLFVERAQLVRPRFDPGPALLRTVARICARLDGLPLAIELAAARARALSVEDIEARLDDRFRLLAERGATVNRHRTLRAAVDWSYELLNLDMRRSLNQLAVFRGGFGLEAAARVLGMEDHDAVELLADLADRSLVNVVPAASGTRYRLLETIRAYASERLVEAGLASLSRADHRAWIRDLASRPQADHLGPGGPEWHHQLDTEYSNVLLALETAHADGSPEEALELCHRLWLWFWLRGHLSDGRQACERALDACPDAPPEQRAGVLLGQGLLAFAQFDMAAAGPALDAVRAMGGGGDRLALGWSALFSAQLAAARGDADTARLLLPDALALAEEVAPPAHLAGAYYWASSTSAMLGDAENADRLLNLALTTARQVRAPYVLTRFLPVLGKRYLAAGDEHHAIELFNEALDTARTTRDRAGIARASTILAELYLQLGRFDRAESLLDEALPIVQREIDDEVFGCKVSLALASLHRQRGAYGLAQSFLDRALTMGARLTSSRSSTDPYREQAALDFVRGDFTAASAQLVRSEEQARHSGHVERLRRCLILRAELEAIRGSLGAASRALEESITIRSIVVPVIEASIDHVRGRIAAASSRQAEAEVAFRRAFLDRLERGYELRAVESAEGLAGSSRSPEQAPAAGRLLGAASAERIRLGAPRPPVSTAPLTMSERRLRTTLGDAAFDRAFDDGFQLGLHGIASQLRATAPT